MATPNLNVIGTKLGRVLSAVTLGLMAATPTSAAVVILQPTGISSPQGSLLPPFDLSKIIDQSGLSSAYTSGITDFDIYTASNTHNSSIAANSGSTDRIGGFPQQITLDLGSAQNIGAIAYWAPDGAGGSVTRFRLFQDEDSDVLNGTGPQMGLSIFTEPGIDAGPAVARIAQVFTFPATTTRFVHLYVDAIEGTVAQPTIGELAFGSGVVPEPAAQTVVASALLVVGGGVVLYRRRSLAQIGPSR